MLTPKKFEGLILKESLKDEKVLGLVNVVKTETWNVKNAEKNQPKVWHAIYVEGESEKANEVAETLSKALSSPGWYTNLSTDKHIFVIFPNKVFKYVTGDKEKREEAIKYGRKIGIPESQLDWKE
ncbi:hypothetical protein HY405_01175 [Candidatus Microgenomates bacterium]|nr:hypothetical protein [Candidatus Microgenomates bacterium]